MTTGNAGAQWPETLSLTSRGHGTDTEGRRGRGQAELVQHCVGTCRVNHCDFTGGAQARHEPHRALTGEGRWRADMVFGNMTLHESIMVIMALSLHCRPMWCLEEDHRCN